MKTSKNPLLEYMEKAHLSPRDMSLVALVDVSTIYAARSTKFAILPKAIVSGITYWSDEKTATKVAKDYIAYREALRKKLMGGTR
jgi:hypothetical protein